MFNKELKAENAALHRENSDKLVEISYLTSKIQSLVTENVALRQKNEALISSSDKTLKYVNSLNETLPPRFIGQPGTYAYVDEHGFRSIQPLSEKMEQLANEAGTLAAKLQTLAKNNHNI